MLVLYSIANVGDPIVLFSSEKQDFTAQTSSYFQGISIIYSSPFLRCLQTATQASLAIGIDGVRLSKHLSEILTAECGITGVPEVPCDDISSYSVTITQSDSRGFPKYPETARESVLRCVCLCVSNTYICIYLPVDGSRMVVLCES